MTLRTLVYFVLMLCSLNSLNAYAEYISEEYATLYDEPGGEYRWYVFRLVTDTAPKPGTVGHDASFPVKNSEGWSVYYVEHIHFAFTSTDINPLNNDYADILYAQYDFDEEQVATINSNFDQLWATSNIYPVPTRIADASIVYNCFAHALGYSDRVINSIKFFTDGLYFPSGIPDWRLLQSQEKPSRAAHGYKYEEHGSIVTQETRTFTFGGYTFSGVVNVYTGKYGERGVYKSDGVQAPEYCFERKTTNRKQT